MSVYFPQHWFEQSMVKLETAEILSENIKKRLYEDGEDPEPHDIVILNQCILLIRSPVDYALKAVADKNSGQSRVSFPRSNKRSRFIKELKDRTKCKDEHVLDLFWSLRDETHKNYTWFKRLNDMSNNDKHNSINQGKLEVKIPMQSNLQIEGLTIEVGDMTFHNMNNNMIDSYLNQRYGLSQNPENRIKNRKIYFDYDNQEVFSSIAFMSKSVNEFMIDVFEYTNPGVHDKYYK